jgi:hypothetical protein
MKWFWLAVCGLAHQLCRAQDVRMPNIVVTDASPSNYETSFAIQPSFFSNVVEKYWDTVYFRMACGDNVNYAPRAIDDEKVKKLIKFTKCSDLLNKNIYVLDMTQTPAVSVTKKLQTIPLNNIKDGLSVPAFDLDPPIPKDVITSCCNQQECPEKCIDASHLTQDCYIEVYILVKGNSNGALLLAGWLRLAYFLLFRIKCEYCFVTNCVKECKNGKVTIFQGLVTV